MVRNEFGVRHRQRRRLFQFLVGLQAFAERIGGHRLLVCDFGFTPVGPFKLFLDETLRLHQLQLFWLRSSPHAARRCCTSAFAAAPSGRPKVSNLSLLKGRFRQWNSAKTPPVKENSPSVVIASA
jgi:hypothetical protein